MRVVAALCWYDEPIRFLVRCIGSLAGVADEVVCYDGAWDFFDGGTCSDETQWAAIGSAAADAGITATIYAPDTKWASQVEKRAALMLDARERGADWIIVIDGDEYVAEKEPSRFRGALFTEVTRDVAMVGALRLQKGEIWDTKPSPIRRVYRANTGVTVDTAHNGYRTKDGKWLHGDSVFVPLEPAVDLSAALVLHHEAAHRGAERDARRLEYRRHRRELGLEEWRRMGVAA